MCHNKKQHETKVGAFESEELFQVIRMAYYGDHIHNQICVCTRNTAPTLLAVTQHPSMHKGIAHNASMKRTLKEATSFSASYVFLFKSGCS